VTDPLQRLIRCIELSSSTNDHEALAAIRKANGILKSHQWTWSSLLAGRQAVFEQGVRHGFDAAQQQMQQRANAMGGGMTFRFFT
jgi:hypothetical protein